MGSRTMRYSRKVKTYEAGIDTFIERLKKIRALNCNPSDVGIDNMLWKRLFADKTQVLSKFL